MRYLLLALVLAGCAKPISTTNNIDPAFQPLYDQFIQQANADGLNLDPNQGMTIQFANLEQQNSLGEVCW